MIERSDVVLNPSALPRIISAEEGCFWFRSIVVTTDCVFLPAYRLAREVSAARH